MFVRAANKHRAEIWVEKDGEQVNGRSIMGLMMLSAGQGTKLILSAEGADAAKAIRELELLIEKRFDEESYLNER
jgi:phosphocarrier protein HPr